MENLLKQALLLIDQYSIGFYAFGLLGLLFYLQRARLAARQRRYTPYPIEREEATTALRDSLMILTLFIAILATTFYIDRILLDSADAGDALAAQPEPTVAPTSPAIGAFPTQTPDPDIAQATAEAATESAATPTPPPDGEPAPPPDGEPSPMGEVTPDVAPTETATEPIATETAPPPVEPTATFPPPSPTAEPTEPATAIPTQPPAPTAPPAPTTPPVPAANCNTPGVRITSPPNGQVVSGNVNILGTASIEGQQFYKVEFGQGGNPGSFSVIGDLVRQSVTDGFLASWPASAFPSGIWTLRLTAVDETGNFPPPCDIRVVVP